MKIIFFWDVTQCSLVDRNQRCGGTCCHHLQSWRDRGCEKEVSGADYMTSYPRIPKSLYSQPEEHLTSEVHCNIIFNQKFSVEDIEEGVK
jgi:hypothetical protein